MASILTKLQHHKKSKGTETLSLADYLEAAAKDPSFYRSPAERMLKAIGEPKVIDTSQEARLGRVFGNRVIKTYEVFKDFYGMEDVIEKIVSYFKHAAQGLEESRQILYLLGPVGSAKSSISERLKSLMEQEPIYVLTAEDGEVSPIYESPLGLLDERDSEELKIPTRYLKNIPSPWAIKRLDEYGGDISKFTVTKMHPSQLRQIAISKTEPGDETNQDISTLVGKLNIRQLAKFSQDDPDAYSYTGGLCLSNQGLLEFVEMFKAPIKVLHPLLTATQEQNYKGTEAVSAIPFNGVVLAHSNESEWEQFKNNKSNEAFLDRVCLIKVPYCLRRDDEIKIYRKLLESSSLSKAPCAPKTLDMLAEFCILTRLDKPENSSLYSKLQVYNGENIKAKDVKSKSLQEYKDLASMEEGFKGISTRQAYKILAKVFNFDSEEIGANPVHLLYVLTTDIIDEIGDKSVKETLESHIENYLVPEYRKKVEKDIQTSYLDSYAEYGQAMFDRYVKYADAWVQDHDFRDPDTGQMFDKSMLSTELEKIEKPAGIANPKDFRHEVVNFVLRHQAKNDNKNPDWRSYMQLRKVIEANMFKNTQDLLPVISFDGHGSKEEQKKHQSFLERMEEAGYTEKQTRLVVEWYMRVAKT